MLILISYSIFIAVLYTWLLLGYNGVWHKQFDSDFLVEEIDLPYFSIVIVSRDEPQLKACIQSISNSSYPKARYEIIIVDDHSKEGSLQEIIDLAIPSVSIIHLRDYEIPKGMIAYKKYGQQLAITKARYDWIVSTDGDCICPPDWLRIIARYSKHYTLFTGPINVTGPSNLLTRLQQFDVIGTMIGTNYGINKQYWFSANAANMAFTKELYWEHNDLTQASKHASGDDVFLIQFAAIMEEPIAFMNNHDAIVTTEGETSWIGFYNQRIRWASKSAAYKDRGMQLLIYGVGFYNLSIVLMLLGGIVRWDFHLFLIGFISYIMKCLIEYWLFSRTASFFKLRYTLSEGFILSGMHILYFIIIGLASIVVSDYKWKGRKVH